MTDPTRIATGLTFLSIGLIGARYAKTFSRLSKRLDAIGDSTADSAPSKRVVRFNRVVFSGVAVAGLVLVGQGLT